MMRLSLSGRSSRSLNFLLLLAPDHGPALELGNRPAFLNPHQIANRVRVGFIVRVVLLGTPNGLLHRRVRKTPIDAHDNGLVFFFNDTPALELSLFPYTTLFRSILVAIATLAPLVTLIAQA